MSWVVEQSDNTSSVHVNGDTITCTSDKGYGSPINALYKDPAEQNGNYFWEFESLETSSQGGGSISVGLTNEQSFKPGWGITAMKYLGNLSDGGGLLVQRFGDSIKQGDKVGILLQLSDSDMKMYIFHNDRPLGLAFHFESPVPKPLYPIVGFSDNGKVKISRSQQIPKALDRGSLEFSGVEGNWKIIDYPQHPECVDVEFEITRSDQGENLYHFHGRVVNILNSRLEHDPTTNQWKSSGVSSTRKGGPPEKMRKEQIIISMMTNIQTLDVDGQQHLTLTTNNGEQVRLQRFSPAAPATVTKNIFE